MVETLYYLHHEMGRLIRVDPEDNDSDVIRPIGSIDPLNLALVGLHIIEAIEKYGESLTECCKALGITTAEAEELFSAVDEYDQAEEAKRETNQ